MPVRTAHATVSGADEVARSMRAALAPAEPVVVLYFAGGDRDPRALAEAMQRAFPGALVIGCTTAGERECSAWRKGSVVAIIYQMAGGLRASMGYCGCASIDEMREKAEFVEITSAGIRESHVHDVQITKEAPNYRVE